VGESECVCVCECVFVCCVVCDFDVLERGNLDRTACRHQFCFKLWKNDKKTFQMLKVSF